MILRNVQILGLVLNLVGYWQGKLAAKKVRSPTVSTLIAQYMQWVCAITATISMAGTRWQQTALMPVKDLSMPKANARIATSMNTTGKKGEKKKLKKKNRLY